MKYELLYDRVLVKDLRSNRTESGLVVPDSVMANIDGTPHVRSEVIAIGHGRITPSGNLIPLKVVPGDIVLWMTQPGKQLAIPLDGVEYWLITEPMIALIFRGLDKVTSIVSVDGGNLELPS